jgi:8-oxo-dGTP pyrophosphatase MutT (NUDIX family)
MNLLREIYRSEGVNKEGKAIHREAVRAIIPQGRKLLLIYSPRNGSYKFPGGGVEEGETKEEALVREIQEECGATVLKIENEFGQIIEYDFPIERDYDVFMMTSTYYFCQVDARLGVQHLDRYEQNLGFRPVWVNIDEAIHTNQLLLWSKYRRIPSWSARETFVLERVKQEWKEDSYERNDNITISDP